MQTLQTSTPARLCYLHLASKDAQRQIDFYRRMLDMDSQAQADGSWMLSGPQRAMLVSPSKAACWPLTKCSWWTAANRST